VQLGHEGGFQSTPGKLGEAGTSVTVREDIVNADKKIVEAVFNEQLIPWIWELNFAGQAARPVFSRWEDDDIDEPLSRRDEALSRTGVRFKPVYFQRNYGLQEDEFTITEPVSGTPAGQGSSFAEKDAAKNIDPGRVQIEALTERLGNESDFAEIWAPIEKLIASAGSFEELRDGILELESKIPIDSIGNIMQKALAAAELSGRYELLKKLGKVK